MPLLALLVALLNHFANKNDIQKLMPAEIVMILGCLNAQSAKSRKYNILADLTDD